MYFIKQITFLRFLAACLVVVVHFGQGTFPFGEPGIHDFIKEGAVIVSFFFFLSGFVLALNYLKQKAFDGKLFYIKRIARVYPVYLLAFVFTLLAIMIFNNAYPKGLSIILQALSLHSWYPGFSLGINFPSWTVAVEVFFYLIFPILLPIYQRMNLKKATVITLVVWAVSFIPHYLMKTVYYMPDSHAMGEFNLYFPLWHLNTFLFGMLCAKYIIWRNEIAKVNYNRARIVYLGGAVLFFGLMLTDNPIRPFVHNGLLSPIFFMVLSGLSLDESLFTKILGNKTFLLLGNTSYAIYIFQWPLYVVMRAVFGLKELNGMYFYIYFSTLLAFSIFIFLFYENRMRRLIIQKWVNQKT